MSFSPVPMFSTNDAADRERLNQIITNLNVLDAGRVQVRYSAYGEVRTDRLRIACGVVDADNPNAFHRIRWVNTGNFFTPGTRPVATATLASLRARRSTLAIAQRTGQSPILDHTGFQAAAWFIHETGNLPYGPNFINWIMMGY